MVQVFLTPVLDPLDRRHVGELRLQPNRKLRLPARPFQVQHQISRDLQREIFSVILLDQGQLEVDPRRDTSGTVEIAVAN